MGQDEKAVLWCGGRWKTRAGRGARFWFCCPGSVEAFGGQIDGDELDITGDLTLNGVTKSVVLDTTLNQAGEHPMEKKPWIGLTATTTLIRSEFNLGMVAPFVSDEVPVTINLEAGKAD